jgi:hypothetical protein
MWRRGFDIVGRMAHMRVTILGKPGCPVADLTVKVPQGLGMAPGAPFTACSQWHTWARHFILAAKPALLVVTQAPVPDQFTPAQWRAGTSRALEQLDVPGMRVVMLGDVPVLPKIPTDCLASHPSHVQACSGALETRWTPYSGVEQEAAQAHQVQYIDPTAWFCSSECSAVIGGYEVYANRFHITGPYAQYLSVVLGQALGLVPARSAVSGPGVSGGGSPPPGSPPVGLPSAMAPPAGPVSAAGRVR